MLLAQGDIIGVEAILLPDGSTHGAAPAGTGQQSGDEAQVAGGVLVGKTVAQVEQDLIIDTLKHCLGNRTHAANILGISIRTLRNKLNLYVNDGVSVPGNENQGSSASA